MSKFQTLKTKSTRPLISLFFLWALLLGLFIPVAPAQAEYRVYLLEISNSDQTEINYKKSTLDPIQYSDIYPLKPNHRIRYVDSWRCFESRPNFQELCSKPTKASPNKASIEKSPSPPVGT